MFFVASTVTLSGLAFPDASPLQPTKCQPAAGVAVRSTFEPKSYSAWSGTFATEPEPTTVTLTAYWLIANVAVMFFAASTVTDSGFAFPVASPLQPTKCQPAAGVAVRSTFEPES